MRRAVTVGQQLPELVKAPIERIQLVKYAGASGDFNRIHVEDAFAKEAGYPTVFAHGMLSMAFLGQAVTDWAGGPRAVRKLSTRFRAITWPGDVITCHGEVTAIDGERAIVKLWATNQKGETTCEGSAELVMGDMR